MQVTVNLPDKFTEKIKDKWGDLPQKILSELVLSAFKDGLIDLDELKDVLNFVDDARLMEFLKKNNMLHASGIINLYGSCADIDFAGDKLGISDEMDDDLRTNFDN
jgi:hypothetical protein